MKGRITPVRIGDISEARRKPFLIGKNQEEISPFRIETEHQVQIKPYVLDMKFGEQKETEAKNAAMQVCMQEKFCGEVERASNKTNAVYADILTDAEKEGLCRDLQKTCKEVKKAEEREKMAFVPVSNYELIPIEKHIFINRKGNAIIEKELIRTKVIINGQVPEMIDVLTSEIKNIANIVGKRFSMAMLDVEENKADKYVEQRFRMRTRGIPIIKNYIDAGWQIIDGNWIYLSDSCVAWKGVKIQTGMSLPSYNLDNIEIGNILMRALNLYNDKVAMGTMFLYAFSGVMYKLFEEAGHAPRFLLFVNGKTGSMKTTIARILFVQLHDEKQRGYVRRIDSDTIVSFERAIVKRGVDTVLVFDDYAPAKTPQKKLDMQNKLETLIRIIGDGSTKSRSNASLDDVQGEGVHGTVVLTGEMRGRGLSSNLRCVYCELQRENVNVEMVTWFQENMDAFTSVIANFTKFLAQNWDVTVDFIKSQFPIKRKAVERSIRERRIVDSVVVLHIIADILEQYCVQWCGYEQLYAKTLFSEMRDSVIVNAKYSQAISEEETPAILFMRALEDLIRTSQIRLCEKNTYTVGGGCDGFVDEKYYYFVPERIYEKIQRLFGATHQYFALDMRETVIALHEEGIIKTHSNGLGKRTYYSRIGVGDGKKQKFLKIPKQIFEELEENS